MLIKWASIRNITPNSRSILAFEVTGPHGIAGLSVGHLEGTEGREASSTAGLGRVAGPQLHAVAPRRNLVREPEAALLEYMVPQSRYSR